MPCEESGEARPSSRSCPPLPGRLRAVGAQSVPGHGLRAGFPSIQCARSGGGASDAAEGTGRKPGALRLPAPSHPTAKGGLAVNTNVSTVYTAKRACRSALAAEAAAGVPLPVGAIRGRREERCLGHGLHVGQALRRETVPHPDHRGLPYERGSRDRCENKLPSLPGHRRARPDCSGPGQAAEHSRRQWPGVRRTRSISGPTSTRSSSTSHGPENPVTMLTSKRSTAASGRNA